MVYEGRELAESAWCSIPFNEEGIGSMYLMLAATTLYFLIPMVTVTFIYIRWGTRTISGGCDRSLSSYMINSPTSQTK